MGMGPELVPKAVNVRIIHRREEDFHGIANRKLQILKASNEGRKNQEDSTEVCVDA